MSESIELKDPLYKLVLRFSNGEKVHYITTDPIDAQGITAETRYAVITSVSCQDPSECTDISVISLRDVTFIKTVLVTLDQLRAERRKAGIRSTETTSADDRLPKSLAQLKFV